MRNALTGLNRAPARSMFRRVMTYLAVLVALGTFLPGTACSLNDPPNGHTPQLTGNEPILLGGPADESGVAVVPAGDGGWFVVANTRSFGAGEFDIWLVKTDASFTRQWDKTFGTATEDRAWNAVSDGAGGILIAGHTGTWASETGDLVFIRVEAGGEVLWYRTYYIPGQQGRGYVQRVGDAGYILSGWSTPAGGLSDYLLLRTDAEGEELWHHTYGGDGKNGANSVRVLPDGGFAIFGEGLWTGGDDYEIWQGILVRTDPAGAELWHRDFGRAGAEEGYGLALAHDGGFLVGGFSASDNTRGAYCARCDADGSQLWWRRFPGPIVVFQIEPVAGGYLVVGPNTVRRIDEEGGTIWSRDYTAIVGINSLTVRPGGGLILIGTAEAGGAGGDDVALLLTDDQGNPL